MLKLRFFFEDKEHVYIILDYCKGGSLYSYFKNHGKLPEQDAFVYFFQTCLGLDYLHKKKIVHRDLKPENLLLDANGCIKISDFGWSAMIEGAMRNTYCGTIDYMAPEIVKNQPHDEKVDLWSVGVLLYELTQGKPPFVGENFQEKNENILNNKISPFEVKITGKCKDIIGKLLCADPKGRLRMDQVFQHDFFVYWSKKTGIDISKYIYKQKGKASNVNNSHNVRDLKDELFKDSGNQDCKPKNSDVSNVSNITGRSRSRAGRSKSRTKSNVKINYDKSPQLLAVETAGVKVGAGGRASHDFEDLIPNETKRRNVGGVQTDRVRATKPAEA